ncbi:hypothetical protein [Parvularcula sp. LCG005]|uniref:hypothetical protein n=1 Tax=Parvularcula sp. LCG005 TaxID=3078805 RepID=UPI002942C3A1|nr:hypothetical protein [Parvularcula sp. LCG005]WOI53036.1 hypothetical protein RUI03_12860 [Parvularcula sp. LCG005]
MTLVIASFAMTPFVLIGVNGNDPNREWWYGLYGVAVLASLLAALPTVFGKSDETDEY